MKSMQEIADNNQINESAIYEDVINNLIKAKENGTPIEEGLIGSLFGGIAGVTAGPVIMKAVCSVLGVNEKGAFGNLLTSKLILGALGLKLGWKM